MNISFEQAHEERNISLFKFVKENGSLPNGFPDTELDSYGVVCLHRYLLRDYLQIERNFNSLSPNEVQESDIFILDTEAGSSIPNFDELCFLMLRVFYIDSDVTLRSITRLNRQVVAAGNHQRCEICKILKRREQFR